MCHSRKRRPRASQDMYDSNTSTNSFVPFATTSGNGQSRKKSDLSCVGKLFFSTSEIKKKSYLVLFKDKIMSLAKEKMFPIYIQRY